MKTKPQGFGPKPPSTEQIDEAFEKLSVDVEENLIHLQKAIVNPTVRAEVDALFGLPCSSNDPSYKAAYDRAYVARMMAPQNEVEMMEAMRPFVKQLLSEIS